MKILRYALGIILIGLVIGSLFLMRALHYESTDDASITADVTQVSAKVAGQITRVTVSGNQEVKQGDLLAEIDPRDYEAKLAAAKAAFGAAESAQAAARSELEISGIGITAAESQLNEARANFKAAGADAKLANRDLIRYQMLFERDEVSKQQLDKASDGAKRADAQAQAAGERVQTALANLRQAESRVADSKKMGVGKAQLESAKAQAHQAEASLRAAELNLSYTTITAPVSGRITNRTVEPGNYVQPGEILLAIVPSHVWVVANFKETQLARIRPGQSATIKIDAYPGKTFKAHVDSIQAGTGSAFSLLPPENATGNYVKVVQRVPVKIVFDEPIDPAYRLSPGMSVVPKVNVK